MVCQVCGRSVEAEDRFCTGCGVSLAEHPPVASDVAADTGDAGAGSSAPAESVAAGARDPGQTTSGVTTAERESGPGATPRQVAPPVTDRDPGSPADVPTELVEFVDDDGWGDADPVWAQTAPTPRTSAAGTPTSDLPETQPITEVWDRGPAEGAAITRAATQLDVEQLEPAGATEQMPAVGPTYEPPVRRYRFSAVTVFGIIAGAITLAAFFTTIISVDSNVSLIPLEESPVGFRTGTWLIDDLADNLSIGGLLGVLAIVVGAIAAIFRWRWGSGLAAGAGLSIAGLAMLAIGLAQRPIDAAQEFAAIPNEQVFTLTITRDVGYWMLVVAGALGIVTFFAALNDAGGDQRPGLNPWIAALGGLATVVAVGGPLLPENLADFNDNWYLGGGPGDPSAMLLTGRLVQLALLLIAGLIGFLSVRRWGLGVAIGGALPSLWLAVSTLFEITDNSTGPGWRNPGADDVHLHGVTIIGISALLAMWVLAAIAAYDQTGRERR